METNGKTIIEKFKEAAQVKERLSSYKKAFFEKIEKDKEAFTSRMKEEK